MGISQSTSQKYYFLVGLPPVHMIRGPVQMPGGQPLFLQQPPPRPLVHLACGKLSEDTCHQVMLTHCTVTVAFRLCTYRAPLSEITGDVVHRPCFRKPSVQHEHSHPIEPLREVTPTNMMHFPKGFQLQTSNLGHHQVYPPAPVQHPTNAIPTQRFPFPSPVYVPGTQFYPPW